MEKRKIRIYLFIGILIASLWFLLMLRGILAPFILAMIFAYIFNPLINFFNHKLKTPRSLSILLVYIILIVSSIFLVSYLLRSILSEMENIQANAASYIATSEHFVNNVPSFVSPILSDYIQSLQKSPLVGNLALAPFPVVTKAFSGILGLFIFVFAAFFFLKDGKKMVDKTVSVVPFEHRDQAYLLLRRINKTLASYLRGQFMIIFSMLAMVYLGLSVLGIKYALTISLFTAILEIVPFIGPFAAIIFSIVLTLVSGGVNNFGLNVLQISIAVILVEYVARLIQDYLIAPFIIGKATKIHPLVILFSVLAGEHLYGILGVLMAVPVAATIKIIYQFAIEMIESPNKAK